MQIPHETEGCHLRFLFFTGFQIGNHRCTQPFLSVLTLNLFDFSLESGKPFTRGPVQIHNSFPVVDVLGKPALHGIGRFIPRSGLLKRRFLRRGPRQGLNRVARK